MMHRDILGIVFLALSLVFSGSWAPILRLAPTDTRSSSATLETARFMGGSGEVIRSLHREDVHRSLCYTQLDLSSAYFTVSLVPFMFAFILSDNHKDLVYGLSWALVGFSCLGGFLLAFGHLISQWAMSTYGPPLPPTQALQSCLAIFIATLTNFEVEQTMTVSQDMLVLGFAFFVLAIVLGARAQQVQQRVQADPSAAGDVAMARKGAKKKISERTMDTKSIETLSTMEAGESMTDREEDSKPSATGDSNSVSRRRKKGSPEETKPEPAASQSTTGGTNSWLNSTWFFGKTKRSPEEVSESKPQSVPDSASINDNNSVSRRKKKEEPKQEPTVVDQPPISGMMIKRRVTCSEVIVAITSGLAFGSFSTAFNIAMNDPFNWTDKSYKTLNDLLLVARTFVFFGFTFWITSFLGNLLRLYLERPDDLEDTRQPISRIIRHYLTKDSFSEREQYASLAGICYALGTMLHFQGGKITGYASAELVQASPIITVFWIVFVLKDFKNIQNSPWLRLLYTAMYLSYLIAITLYMMSGFPRPTWLPSGLLASWELREP